MRSTSGSSSRARQHGTRGVLGTQAADNGKVLLNRARTSKSYQLDANGNPINKRNAWQARSVLYVRLIPPGAADVTLPRRIPRDAVGPSPSRQS